MPITLSITKATWLNMIRNRFWSCLAGFSDEQVATQLQVRVGGRCGCLECRSGDELAAPSTHALAGSALNLCHRSSSTSSRNPCFYYNSRLAVPGTRQRVIGRVCEGRRRGGGRDKCINSADVVHNVLYSTARSYARDGETLVTHTRHTNTYTCAYTYTRQHSELIRTYHFTLDLLLYSSRSEYVE